LSRLATDLNAPLSVTALASLPDAEAGLASALFSTSKQTGQLLGIAAVGTALATASVDFHTAYKEAGVWVWAILIGCGVGVVLLNLAPARGLRTFVFGLERVLVGSVLPQTLEPDHGMLQLVIVAFRAPSQPEVGHVVMFGEGIANRRLVSVGADVLAPDDEVGDDIPAAVEHQHRPTGILSGFAQMRLRSAVKRRLHGDHGTGRGFRWERRHTSNLMARAPRDMQTMRTTARGNAKTSRPEAFTFLNAKVPETLEFPGLSGRADRI